MKVPSLVITTFSLHLRNNLVGNGQFITVLPRSMLQIIGKRHSLAELPIKLSVQPARRDCDPAKSNAWPSCRRIHPVCSRNC